jgi:hypothetical protein
MPRRDSYSGTVGTLRESGLDQLRGIAWTLESGGLIPAPGPAAREAATHLIAGFDIGMTPLGWPCGTLVWFEGNTKGTKVSGGARLGPEQLDSGPRGFWPRLSDELKQSARIDRQKYLPGPKKNWYCDYHVQIGDASIACVLVRVNFDVGARAMQHAFHLSLEFVKNVWVDPTDNRNGYFRIES